MLSTMERLSVYSVLCVIAMCSLLLQAGNGVSLIPVVAFFGAVLGIYIEMRAWNPTSEEAEDN
ncbi:hypothetical protein JCM19233_7165 [Vibrio astriarenae]|uniref:Uncharacterized protein n=1 Tax=Vibrio astriarenae TaxID=1481923 RepID=A0A7Z2T0G4_9VIBR|nr:hypothetical protein [Vibrio astriarenae]QIA62079.1 hypothetical protein GT360_00245 [Vibrio astriarenae]GAL16143.1 hypothetical protein JCM19233_7165 [Vibrio sp. C7]